VKKALCVVLSLSILLVTSPLSVKAAHTCGDNCYVSGCSKHVHSSTCESVSNDWNDILYSNLPVVKCRACAGYRCPEGPRCGGSDYMSIYRNNNPQFCGYCQSCKTRYYSEPIWYQCRTCGLQAYTGKSYYVGCSCGAIATTDINTLFPTVDPWEHNSGGMFCNECNGHTQVVVSITCGKDATTYYDSSGNVASKSCNKVVKSLNLKK